MKTTISIHRFIDNLRNEQSNYIIALLMICCLSILLLTSILMKSYSIATLLISSRQEVDKVTALHVSAQSDNAPLNTAATSRWDFFGTSAVVDAAPSNYVLVGIVYSADDPTHAKVIISSNANEGDVFGVGDKLDATTVIDRIENNDVILLHNGVRQVLSLTWEGESDILTQPNQLPAPVAAPTEPAMLDHIQRMRRPGYPTRPGFPVEKYTPGE